MNFASILDKNYIPRLNALLYSLDKHESSFTYFVIALDIETSNFFQNRKNCIIITIDKIESNYPILKLLKNQRSSINYLFTLSPFYPSYILEAYPELDHICTLDVDQYFFSSPKPIFKLLDEYSVLITPHRFTSSLLNRGFEVFGKYNVSFQIFKNDETGLACLNLWRKQCVNWCFDHIEKDLYADQKYLETWNSHFENKILEITNKGLGLAPWNIENVRIIKKKNKIYVDNELLILYHYQGLKVLDYGFIYTYLDNYSENKVDTILNLIYKPILKKLLTFTVKVDSFIRNNLVFDINFLKEKSDYVIKRKFGFLFIFTHFLFFKEKVLRIKK